MVGYTLTEPRVRRGEPSGPFLIDSETGNFLGYRCGRDAFRSRYLPHQNARERARRVKFGRGVLQA